MSALQARAGANTCAEALVRPSQSGKSAPCVLGCASGNEVCQWIGLVAQRAKLGLSEAQAYARAWRLITETNPFPATLGRICPHPCETACNRAGKDGAVAINAMERFLGDWALQHELQLTRHDGPASGASVGVIGSGPAGLSFAYQLARRGVRVIVAGLDQDYLGKPFEPMPQLLAIAEYITKTLAICMVCGAPANHTQRLVASSERVLVGAQGTYEARCRQCFDPRLGQ